MLKKPTPIRNIALLTAGVCVLGFGVKRTQYTTSAQVVDTLTCDNKKWYAHEDQETTDILNLMSGTIDTKNFEELLDRYGYVDIQISSSVLREKDEALYHTLREMHTKYGNPKVSFSGDFRNYEHMIYNFFHPFKLDKRVEEYDRPRFNFLKNKIAIYGL